MQVFKFGGASVNSLERIRSLVQIFRENAGQSILVVISAMGKTTNALEKVAESFYRQDKEKALQLFDQIKQEHYQTAKALLTASYHSCEEQLLNFFTEVEWLLHDQPVQSYDYYYDQIVCIGELLSTSIVSAFLNESGIKNEWLDVRDILRTDDNFRDANIDWEFSASKVNQLVKPLLADNGIVLTQGFIGSTDENESTTLGREGSDYSAAVFANLLNAEKQTIWKDVAGVMNADPKIFPTAQLISTLNYTEVIEMAYYGAQVIHPKTIKPLQNKGIPLQVKCFLDTSLPGTLIHNEPVKNLPPIIVWKQAQVLLQLKSKDFSFVGEKPVAALYHIFAQHSMRPNMTQNGAISFTCVLDENAEKLEQLAFEAAQFFEVSMEKGLSLLTIRHNVPGLLDQLIQGKEWILKQETRETVQALLKTG
ncbi:aspartate kinase [Flavihumibacter sp. CACIAM 22H1]|uniref:aspartate kinase n=1 Tax=Flavihumibacter sp. CACIAM 22H1 TaxID=1812911 RepID=UPI0007A8FF66|nr:aspartate kinase [Flavihumibacter sp. CACIAM 22H1]KYP14945.1 MAG: aspartate kinase [Flavihumibacter sp. CACIAM 22H1]